MAVVDLDLFFVSVVDLPARLWQVRTRLIRFAGVSVFGVVLTQVLLVLLKGGLNWSGVAANIVATAASSVPVFLLNRRWVWNKRGDHSFSREMAPFWADTLVGLVLSTALVAVADNVWGTTIAVNLANLTGWGLLWVGKFALLEKVLFREDDLTLRPNASVASDV